jgi:hypothetical protein
LRVVGDLLGLLHGVPEVATERVVVQAITFGGTQVACAPQPLLWVSVSMPCMGVPATALRIVYAAHAAGRLTNGPASSQAGVQEAMRLGVGGAAANSLAKAAVKASGGTVTFGGAGGKGGAAANSLAKAAAEASGGTVTFGGAGGKGAAAAKSRVHAAWLVAHPDDACGKGCGRLFNNLARNAQFDRKRH